MSKFQIVDNLHHSSVSYVYRENNGDIRRLWVMVWCVGKGADLVGGVVRWEELSSCRVTGVVFLSKQYYIF